MDFTKIICESVEEIFSTMIFMEAAAEAPLEEGQEVLGCHVSALIGLSGDFTAMLGLHCPEPVGLDITGAMLGMKLDAVDADVKDALGEITNMLAGGLKARCAATGMDLQLAIPTAISGQSYTISAPKGGCRMVLPFRIASGRMFIEMKYTLPQGGQ